MERPTRSAPLTGGPAAVLSVARERLGVAFGSVPDPRRQLRYGVTSQAPEAVPQAQVLALGRGRWKIEARLHRGRVVVLGEDASRIHGGQVRR